MRANTPARAYAAAAGAFLTALGVVTLIAADVTFEAVAAADAAGTFLVWPASGWTAMFWIIAGVLGLVAMVRADAAEAYALVAGGVFAIVGVWGSLDGNSVAGVLVADTATNVMHLILGAIGLAVAARPCVASVPTDPRGPLRPVGRGFGRTTVRSPQGRRRDR